MKIQKRLRIAIQKSGRLHNDSMDLLAKCGVKIRLGQNALYCHCEDLPIDILFVRDNDIPILVNDGICDLGIVGENLLFEEKLATKAQGLSDDLEIMKPLGFSRCRLSIAILKEAAMNAVTDLSGLKIATTYPYLLKQYLSQQGVDAQILTISGSVEIAPRLEMSQAICDLVSSGQTLEANHLKEVAVVLQSQAVLIKKTGNFSSDKKEIVDLLLRRIEGVLMAQESKYILFHAPKAALGLIKSILPGCETPTIMNLEGVLDKVAVHLVSREGIFWDTLEKLKSVGASSILVLPIEKMMS